MLSTIVAFATIFLYKNRMLQIRMSIFNSLLLVGYYIAFFAFYFALKTMRIFSVSVGRFVYPLFLSF